MKTEIATQQKLIRQLSGPFLSQQQTDANPGLGFALSSILKKAALEVKLCPSCKERDIYVTETVCDGCKESEAEEMRGNDSEGVSRVFSTEAGVWIYE